MRLSEQTKRGCHGGQPLLVIYFINEDGKSVMRIFYTSGNSALLVYEESHDMNKIFKEDEASIVKFLTTGDKFILQAQESGNKHIPSKYEFIIDCPISQEVLDKIK